MSSMVGWMCLMGYLILNHIYVVCKRIVCYFYMSQSSIFWTRWMVSIIAIYCLDTIKWSLRADKYIDSAYFWKRVMWHWLVEYDKNERVNSNYEQCFGKNTNFMLRRKCKLDCLIVFGNSESRWSWTGRWFCHVVWKSTDGQKIGHDGLQKQVNRRPGRWFDS